jgi:squalene monooxygenase
MLRNRIRTEELKPMIRSHFAAVLLEGVNQMLPYPNHGHVVLSDAASPFLMYPIAEQENHCRALIDVPAGSTMEEIEHHLRHTIAPILPVQLRPAFLHALDVRRVRSMPNREMPGQPYKMRGALLLGDAFNCRHPLTGGGMTVALSDVLILSNLLKNNPNLSVLEHGAETLFSQFYRQRKAMSSSINILASALYSVFADPAQRDLREACFQYFQRGGQCVAGPMGLLGGLTPGLGLLVWHFTRVAFVGVGCARSVLHAASMLKRASGIIVPLLING